MGKSMVSGFDFPLNQSICFFWTVHTIATMHATHLAAAPKKGCTKKLPLAARQQATIRKVIDLSNTSILVGGSTPLKNHGVRQLGLPSGKLTKSYGKPQFSMGKSTINHHFQ